MRERVAAPVERLRQPEYTGENRCLPCTIVNVAIAAVLAALLGVVAPPAGLLAFACFLLVIYLRGYLVPGTPTLTKRYLPDRVLARFDHRPEPTGGLDLGGAETAGVVGDESDAEGSAADADATEDGSTEDGSTEDGSNADEPTFQSVEKWRREAENAVEPREFLLEEGAVGRCENAEDVCLTDEFAALVERELRPYRSEDGDGPLPDLEAIASAFHVDPEEVSTEDRDYPAYRIGRRIRMWPDAPALVADVATDRAFRELTDRWAAVPTKQRLEILEALRSFQEACPRCGGAIASSGEGVESCCRSIEVVALDCVGCGGRLVELDPSVVDAA